MSLDELEDDVTATYGELGDDLTVELDNETRTELAMLTSVLGTNEDELVRRGIHLLFQTAVDMGNLDFQLRNEYDVTYDEYLSGMTYDEMAGEMMPGSSDDDRRYQF